MGGLNSLLRLRHQLDCLTLLPCVVHVATNRRHSFQSQLRHTFRPSFFPRTWRKRRRAVPGLREFVVPDLLWSGKQARRAHSDGICSPRPFSGNEGSTRHPAELPAGCRCRPGGVLLTSSAGGGGGSLSRQKFSSFKYEGNGK